MTFFWYDWAGYIGVLLVLSAFFLLQAHRLHGNARRGIEGVALKPMRLFHFSNTYLALLFVLVAVDPLVR